MGCSEAPGRCLIITIWDPPADLVRKYGMRQFPPPPPPTCNFCPDQDQLRMILSHYSAHPRLFWTLFECLQRAVSGQIVMPDDDWSTWVSLCFHCCRTLSNKARQAMPQRSSKAPRVNQLTIEKSTYSAKGTASQAHLKGFSSAADIVT